jgi:uncharacterized linocin/CFP29 family protein
MSEHTGTLPWTDEQWTAMQQLVQDAARRARVGSSFLPLHGPLPPGQSTVPALELTNPQTAGPGQVLERGEAPTRLEIDDGRTLRLATIACDVYLNTQQAEDPDLAAAHDLIARAADIIGRLEDAIVFNGQPAPDSAPAAPLGGPVVSPVIYTVSGGNTNHPGLLTPHPDPNLTKAVLPLGDPAGPDQLVQSVGDAIQTLETYGHYGPFACVLGHDLYVQSVTPNPGSLVLPSDRITPLLDGPLLRSGTVDREQGVVVALAGSPIDLVVATDVHLGYLQRSLEPRYVLRVSERFVLRLKQPEAVCQLRIPDGVAGAATTRPTPVKKAPVKKAAAKKTPVKKAPAPPNQPANP